MTARIVTDESWCPILGFSNYEISDLGNVWNVRLNKLMRTSLQYGRGTIGHVKISLVNDVGERHDRSVAVLVAEAFVEPPNILCDHVIVMDGDPTNLASQNLAWRPRSFSWKYSHQFRVEQPLHYKNLPVVNNNTGDRYPSIIACGIREGLLFEDVWRSTYTGDEIYPYGCSYEIIKRV